MSCVFAGRYDIPLVTICSTSSGGVVALVFRVLLLDEGDDVAELLFLLLAVCAGLLADVVAHTLLQQHHCMDGNRANANELSLAVAIGLTFAFLVVLGSVPSSGEESALLLLLLLLFAACQRRRR